MARMPYCVASACCSSILTLPIFILPLYSSASSSSKGAIILHGPHHSAQKSIKTGVVDCNACCAKFSCVKVTIKGEAIKCRWQKVAEKLLVYRAVQNQHHPNGRADGGKRGDAGGDGKTNVQCADGGRGDNHGRGTGHSRRRSGARGNG